jgi:signal transduction histidine kinase
MDFKTLLRSWTHAGADYLPEYDIKRGICIGVNSMCVIVFAMALGLGGLLFGLTGNSGTLIGAIVEALILLAIINLNRQRRYELANLCLYVIINLSTLYFGVIYGKTAQVQTMALFILGLIFFVFDRFRTRVICVLTTLLTLGLLEANYAYDLIPSASFTTRGAIYIRWAVYLVNISLVLLIFFLYKRNTGLLIRMHTYSRDIKASLTSEERLNQLKNDFFQHISHDIRGAYFGVASICTLIHQRVEQNIPVKMQEAESLIDASETYKYMLNNFLELSRFKNASLDSIRLEPLKLRAEIERIVELHQYIADQRGVKIQVFFSLGFPDVIIGDRLKITRIIYNLLGNALKFTRKNSVVQVRIEQESESWKLTVKDEGNGIPSGQLKKIFDPYVTERSAQNPEGVGLGLYITKHLVEILGASIGVSSQLNKGATFEVSFTLEKVLAAYS